MYDKIPTFLIEQIKEGQAILFLGSGASREAFHQNGIKSPTGQELSDLIAKKFLGDTYINNDLNYVSELAISESSLYNVQKYIYDIFSEFKAGEAHMSIPLFSWHSIFTTNYDLLIEDAYSNIKDKNQTIVKFIKNGQKVNDAMREKNSLMYFKLHGCISEIIDENLPLILTINQYIDYQKNRSNLFERLQSFSADYPVIFVGHSLADADIRATMKLISQSRENQPRHYLVAPQMTDEAGRYWENRKISPIRMNFSEFMRKLKEHITPNERILSFARNNYTQEHPISSRFQSGSRLPTQSLFEFLDKDVDYIHKNINSQETNPKLFYKGYFNDWDPILKNLDVKRKITEDIISEIFLIEEEDRMNKQELFLVHGNAGSGKTVLIHRLAFEAGANFDKLCLVYKSDSSIDYNRLQEISELTGERIYLFVERLHERIEEIKFVINKCKKDNVPITIIGTERTNIWNTLCSELLPFITREYSLKYLDDIEIKNLILLLEKHDSLGYLTNKSYEDKVSALSEKAGRELLVALYEATAGKNLADIVMDEYNKIPSEEAQSIYLTICTFHRVGTYARAGNLSRLHNVNFSYFNEKLFKPLESVVYTKRNYRINDYTFVTRHPYIAEMVFEQVYVNEDDRYNKYIEVLAKLDIDYESDLLVFNELTNARRLMEIFKDNNKIRSIFQIAKEGAGDDPFVMQQESIFEMRAEDGDFHKSESLLQDATEIDPDNIFFLHTRAELFLKRAEKTDNFLIRKQLVKRTKELCTNILQNFKNRSANLSPTYHTLLKTHILELSYYLSDVEEKDDLAKRIQNFEKIFNNAIQEYPNESFLLDAEAKFNELMSNFPAAIESLEKAFEINKSSPYLATRLSNYYIDKDLIKSKEILEESLRINQYDKNLNFLYSKLLLKIEPENYINHRHFLRNSFVKNDNRLEAQFWYARCLYLLEEKEESKQFFNVTKNAPIDYRIKKRNQGEVFFNNTPKIFNGVIIKLERSYGFVKENITGETIYFYREKNGVDKLEINMKINFKKFFNYYGVNAVLI